jgi:hypothetical protein
MSRIPGFYASESLAKSTSATIVHFGPCTPFERLEICCCGTTCSLHYCYENTGFLCLCLRGSPFAYCTVCI